MKFGGPQIALLASDHPRKAHSSTLEPIFTPKLVFLQLLNILYLKKKKVGQKSTFGAPLMQDFLQGKWLKFYISPTTGLSGQGQGLIILGECNKYVKYGGDLSTPGNLPQKKAERAPDTMHGHHGRLQYSELIKPAVHCIYALAHSRKQEDSLSRLVGDAGLGH
eukprot:1161358-Pelagomonas_calceolata.AAC.2